MDYQLNILLHCQESQTQTSMTTLTAMLSVIWSYYIVRSHRHKHQWHPSQQCCLWYDLTTLSGVTDTNINDILTTMLSVIWSYYIVRSHMHKHQWLPSQQCCLWYYLTTLSGVTDTNINDNPHNNVICDMILLHCQESQTQTSMTTLTTMLSVIWS